MSDIHTEFWQNDKEYYHPGIGDVLVLAGDIGCAIDLENNESYFHRFLSDCVSSYSKVFMVLGNHSHYDYDFTKTLETHRKFLPAGITLLENQSEYYNGVHFVGATLWTDFKNGDGLEMLEASRVMNDYHIIKHGNRTLQPADTLHEHDETIEWFNQVLPTLNGPVVMITHHCPHYASVHSKYSGHLLGAYATDLSRMIEQHSPHAWIHGHVHESNNYMIGTTKILSNPRGYAPHEINPNFSETPLNIR